MTNGGILVTSTVLTDLCFSTLKIFSIIIYISMWQRLKTIHRGKLELRKKKTKNQKLTKLLRVQARLSTNLH